MDKLERMLNLTAVLLETRRPLSARQIGEKVPGYPESDQAFRRAFERDKDDLREMGIPIVLEPIPGEDPPLDGYTIHKKDYYLRDPDLDADELAALHLAATAVRLEGVGAGGALAKLGGTAGAAPIGPALGELPTSPELFVLFDAASRRRQVQFDYHDTMRTVDPYRLDFQRGRWYLTGFDHVREDERVYRVDRIEGAVKLIESATFARPEQSVPGMRRNAWELGESEAVTAHVLVDADHAAWARQLVGPEAVSEERDDGAIVLELPVVNRDAFRSMVLGFLEHAEVLDPPELRADMIAWLEACR